jgi:hypothetical protein
MSQQINLYDPALCRRRELLTTANLVAVAALIVAVVVGWGVWERSRLVALEKETNLLAAQNKTLQDEMAALGARPGLKADAGVEAELSSSNELLAVRREVMEELKKRMHPRATNFADYLRALARQTPGGLWLTGFSVSADDASMEIRGRMTEPTLLPEFIRRLNTETVFAGRSFAALQVSAAKPATAPAGQNVPPASVSPAPPYHEFSLVPAKPQP